MHQAKLSRRQFLLSTSSALALLATGCTSLPGRKTHSVTYPRLPGAKIQSPEHYGIEGCMTGIYTGGFLSAKKAIAAYEKMAGRKPTYLLLPYYGLSHVTSGIKSTSLTQVKECASLEVIPFITYFAGDELKSFADLEGIIAGKYDDKIEWAAKDLKAIGDTYGGFFIRTMEHMNAKWYCNWGTVNDSALFKKAWIKIWQIFDSVGTNHFATWVFNPYVPDPYGIAPRYYPGEKYVDWVGMSAYNMAGLTVHILPSSFSTLFRPAYRRIYDKYIGKPIMICETGMHQLPNKPKWITQTFHNVQSKFFGIKGLSWGSIRWKRNGAVYMDMRVNSSPESREAFKKGVADPYFLGPIPYRRQAWNG